MSDSFSPAFSSACKRRRHRSDSHDLRFDSSVSPTHDATERFKILCLHKIFAGDDQRRCAVNYP